MHRPLTGLVVGSALWLTAGTAHAWETDAGGFLLPGVSWGLSPAKTLGAEVSYAHYPDGCCWGFGPRVDAEWLMPRGPVGGTWRTSLGAEVFITGLGFEASLTRQGARDLGPRAGFGTSVGAFASLGFGSIGVRHTRSLDQGDAPVTALVFTAKWMILFYGENPYRLPSNWLNPPSGRPLMVARAGTIAPVVAAVDRTRAWDGIDTARPAGRPGTLRERLLAVIA